MKISVKSGRLEQEKTEVIVISQFEGERGLSEDAAAMDKALRGRIRKALEGGEFSGKTNQLLLLHIWDHSPAKRVLLVGLGKKKEAGLEQIRQAMGTSSRYIRDLGIKTFTTGFHKTGSSKASVEDCAQAIVEGTLLGLYQFTVHRTEGLKDIKRLDGFTLMTHTSGQLRQAEQGASRGQILADAACFSRDLVNHPSNTVTPTRLAKEATTLAKNSRIRCKIIDRPEASRLGMGAFLAVAQGSLEPPKFIILEYHGGKSRHAPIVLVGKSITFDSGGISLKPADRMDEMKGDMAGGAAVLGTMKAVAELKLPISLIGILPAAENMPSGKAIKPGDVVRSLSGKTIEVINTDAEGRMVLADGLTYADRFKPAAIIDLATLTGACIVALGVHTTGLLGNNPRLIENLRTAGEACGERLWELPLWDDYIRQIKSDVADVKNVGNKGGGTITAAAFLSKFVGAYPWAHLDIAGTAWTDQEKPYIPKGASGVGVRLLVRYLSLIRPSASKKKLKKARRKSGS